MCDRTALKARLISSRFEIERHFFHRSLCRHDRCTTVPTRIPILQLGCQDLWHTRIFHSCSLSKFWNHKMWKKHRFFPSLFLSLSRFLEISLYPRSCAWEFRSFSNGLTIIEIIKNSLNTFFKSNEKCRTIYLERCLDSLVSFWYFVFVSCIFLFIRLLRCWRCFQRISIVGNYTDNTGIAWFNDMPVHLVQFLYQQRGSFFSRVFTFWGG